MCGTSCIGCISDTDPQPILIYSKLGTMPLPRIGIINNSEELVQ
jgi:amidophosphoribosyltransferase